MIKKLIIFLITIAIAILVFTLIGCKPDEVVQSGNNITVTSSEDIIFFKSDTDAVEWRDYTLNVFSGDNLLEQIRLTPEILKDDAERDKLNTVGTKTLEILYKGERTFVTVTVKPKPIISEFNVTFNASEGYFGSDVNSKVITKSLSEMDAIVVPKREGYIFAGWFEDIDRIETKYVTGKIVTKDITLYAKWESPDNWSVEYKISIDGAIQDIPGVNKQTFKHGSIITLRIPDRFPSSDFVKYSVQKIVDNVPESYQEYTYVDDQDTTVEVIANFRILLEYRTKTFTVKYSAISPLDGSTFTPIIENVRYGESFDTHFSPLSAVQVDGHSVEWVDYDNNNTVIHDFKTGVFRDYNIVARYTKLKYQVRFLDEDENEILDLRRTGVDYNSILQNPPEPPNKDGHTGFWSILESGNKQKVDISDFYIKGNTNVYAIYDANKYPVQFKFEMFRHDSDYSDALTITREYEFGTELIQTDMINLYQNLTIGEQEYDGFDVKYINVKWQVNRKDITFPFRVSHIADERILRAVWEYRDYIVDFVIPSEYGEYNAIRQTVRPNSLTTPPSYNIEGYTIIGWRHKKNCVDYSADTEYQKNELVRYNEGFYQCEQNSTLGIVPSAENIAYWNYIGTVHPSEEYYFSESNQIEIKDFRQFNAEPFLDRSFTPLLKINEYNVSLYTWKITGSEPNYEIIKNYTQKEMIVEHGSPINPSTYFTEVPKYPDDGRESNFQYMGCFTDSNYTSEMIESNSEVTIKGETSFYAYWTDLLAGTEGLEFEYYSAEQTSYKLVNYNPAIKNVEIGEMVIPAKHNGKPVVSIASGAFASYDHGVKFNKISIPSSIIHIGDLAFLGCSLLETISFDGNDCFVLDAQDSIVSTDNTKIYLVPAQKTYANNTYEISSNTQEIIPGAFANCKNIKHISFLDLDDNFNGSNLSRIGRMAFSGCENLLSFNIPNEVTAIESFAFKGCYKLSTVSIGENSNLKTLGECVLNEDNPWYMTQSNEEFIKLGQVLLTYNYEKSESNEVSIPDEIIAIADGAFKTKIFSDRPSNIISITFNKDSKIDLIGNEAFSGCNVLNTITIKRENHKVSFSVNSFKGISTTCKLEVTNIESYREDQFVTTFFSEENNTLIEIT